MNILNLFPILIIVALSSMNLSQPLNDQLKEEAATELRSSTEGKGSGVTGEAMLFLPEDANSDGVVDSDDLAIGVVESANFCDTGCLADVNGDGLTNVNDIILIFNYICAHLQS